MPVYEFACDACQTTEEVVRSRDKAGALKKCPTCGKKMRRVFGAAIHMGAAASAGGGDFDFGDMGGMPDMPDMGAMGGMGGMDGMDFGGDVLDDVGF